MIELKTAPYAVFLLRVVSGILFLAHGLTKVFVFTIPGTVGFFESLGLPAIIAYLTITAELLGGLALVLGVATRIVSVALISGFTWSCLGSCWKWMGIRECRWWLGVPDVLGCCTNRNRLIG